MGHNRYAVIVKLTSVSLVFFVLARLAASVIPALAGERHGIAGAVLVLCAIRFALILFELLRGARRWPSAIFPALILLGLVGAMGGGHSAMMAKGAAALAEFGVLAVIAYLVVGPNADDGRPIEVRLIERLRLLMPLTVARFMVSEIIIMRAAMTGLFRRRKAPDGFSYTETSAIRILPLLLLFASPVDLVLTDVILRAIGVTGELWSIVLGASYVYGLLWAYGMLVTMRERPHAIEGGNLQVNKGVFAGAAIALDSIASATVLPAAKRKKAKGEADLSVRGAAKVALTLTRPARITQWFVPDAAEAEAVTISADDPAGLCRAIDRGRRQS